MTLDFVCATHWIGAIVGIGAALLLAIQTSLIVRLGRSIPIARNAALDRTVA